MEFSENASYNEEKRSEEILNSANDSFYALTNVSA